MPPKIWKTFKSGFSQTRGFDRRLLIGEFGIPSQKRELASKMRLIAGMSVYDAT
jgi:hypothetical protein